MSVKKSAVEKPQTDALAKDESTSHVAHECSIYDAPDPGTAFDDMLAKMRERPAIGLTEGFRRHSSSRISSLTLKS